LAEEKYHLEIESDPNNLITVEEFVNYFCKDVNLIHANKCDTNKKVTVEAAVENSKLIIKIKDEGEGFDPGSIPDPTEPENLLKDSGRGIYLMRVYMDDLQLHRTPSGMELVLTVNL